MKIKKDNDEYILEEEIGLIHEAWLEPEDEPVALLRTNQDGIKDLKEKSSSFYGRPQYFAIIWGEHPQRLLFWPMPDKDYKIKIQFFPPLKEM